MKKQAEGPSTIILIGGIMTLADGTVIDSRELFNGDHHDDPLPTTSWSWWQTVLSIVDPLLDDMLMQTGNQCFAWHGNMSIIDYEGSQTQRRRVRTILPKNHSYYPNADTSDYNRPFGHQKGFRYPEIEITSQVKTPRAIKQTFIFPHTKIHEAGALDYASNSESGWVKRIAPTHNPGNGITYSQPSPYQGPIIDGDFHITGLVDEGEWCDPRYLEAARRYREIHYDINIPIWDLVHNEILRETLLEEFLSPT